MSVMVNMAIASSNTTVSSSLKLSQACESGKKFAQVFYEKLDKSRHTMGQLFHESAVLIWNGNFVTGKGNVLEFYGNLPTLDTTLIAIDAHPISTEIAGQKTSILVTCNGKMTFDKQHRCFTESFMLIAENNIWKIMTDTYRNY